jgi:hypothetical protein
MRHGVGPDGAAASDEDFLAKAMRRKVVANLDFTCINKSSKSFLAFPTPLIASDGQLLTHLVGEVSEVRLDDGALGSCFELQAI